MDFEQYLYENYDGDSSKLRLVKLPYTKKSLDPAMNEQNVDWHYNIHSKKYVENAKKQGDEFNVAGAVLHNMWWEQLRPYKKDWVDVDNDAILLVIKKYRDLQSFMNYVEDSLMSLQGSGWVIVKASGSVVTVRNHKIVEDAILVIDGWEHAYYPTHGPDKKAYLKELWHCINWKVVAERLSNN